MLTHRPTAVVSLSVLLAAATAHSAITADAVLSFDPGAGAKTAYWGAALNVTPSALGLPASNHDVPDVFDNEGSQIVWADHSVLSPFSAAYAPNSVVSFGAGGHLTLRLSSPVPTTAGPALGVHTGSGLNDDAWPTGQNKTPAETFTDPRVAVVEISADNATWFSLGQQTFNLPSNYYAAGLASPYDLGPGTAVADFAQPFTGQLSAFSGRNWPSTLDLLNGSAGGTWLDLSSATGTGPLPPSIQFVRFSLPSGSPDTFVLDALTAVPEPVTGLLLAATLLTLRRRPR